MPSTTNFGWTTPADTDLVKDGASAIRTLGNGIDTSFVDLKGGTTGQVLSKNSNTDLDFTWVAQDDSNAIQNALLTTTGDTIYASGASTPARLGIGTAGQVLTVSGGVPAWTTISSGGMTLISETVASGASSLSFSSISGSYKQLVMVWSGIQNSSTATTFAVRFNNDSGSNYSFAYLRTIGGSVGAFGQTTTDCSNLKFNTNGSSANLYEQSVGQLVIDNYASTTKNKTYTWQNWYNRSSDAQFMTELTQGTYVSTSAVTSIDIVRTTGAGTFSNTGNTTIRLYGVS